MYSKIGTAFALSLVVQSYVLHYCTAESILAGLVMVEKPGVQNLFLHLITAELCHCRARLGLGVYTENLRRNLLDFESGEMLAMIFERIERVSKAEICQRVEGIFGYFIIYGW
jgi:hypothetical protein